MQNSADGELLEGECFGWQVPTHGSVIVGDLGGGNPDKNTVSRLLVIFS